MRAVAVAALVGFLATPAGAINPVYYQTGNSMIEDCRGEHAPCFAYIDGVVDGLMLYPTLLTFCIPPGIPSSQLAAIFTKYLNENPDKWQMPAGYLVEQSLSAAFPCAK